jgi:hypothetical protein
VPVVSLPLNTRLSKPEPESTRMTLKRHSHNATDMKSLLANIQEKSLECFVLGRFSINSKKFTEISRR